MQKTKQCKSRYLLQKKEGKIFFSSASEKHNVQLYFVVSGVNVTLKWHDVNKTHGYEIIIFRQSFLNLHFHLSLLAMIF